MNFKFLAIAALICACSTTTFAKTKYHIFYGAIASSNPNNPCSGATIRICGKVIANFKVESENETLVQEITLDANDCVLLENTKKINLPLEEAYDEYEFITAPTEAPSLDDMPNKLGD